MLRRTVLISALIPLLPVWVLAGAPDTPQAIATGSAIEALRQQVARLPLGPQWTVGTYLDTTHSWDLLMAQLQQAEMVGGPRTVDAQTVQVRLDIHGQRVAAVLIQAASARVGRSPLSAEYVAREVTAWSGQTFTATGSSVAGRPDPAPAALPMAATPRMEKASDFARRPLPTDPPPSAMTAPVAPGGDVVTRVPAPSTAAASPEGISAARRSAAAGALRSIEPVPTEGGKTVADVLALSGVGDAVGAWIANRPASRIDARDAGEVRVVLDVPPDELLATLRAAVTSLPANAAVPTDDAGWATVGEGIRKALPAQVEGVARPEAPAPAAAAPARPAEVVTRVEVAAVDPPSVVPAARPTAPVALDVSPDRPPAWVFGQVDAEGEAAWAGSKLQTARAAEADAVARLRQQLTALVVTRDVTLGQATAADPRLAEVTERALARARVFRVEYREDGSAAVRVFVDPRGIWQDLVVATGR